MNKKIESITFYKGIAIIMVIFVHYAQIFKLNNFLNEFSRFFQMGCQIFLVLSCFTLSLSNENKKINYQKFIKHRISKIITGYYITIFVYLIIRILFFIVYGKYTTLINAINPLGILLNLMFLHGLYPYGMVNNQIVYGGWFVGTIFILYLIFPLLSKLNNKINKNLKNIFPLIIQIITLIILIIINSINSKATCSNNSFIYFSFINQLPSFCVGFIMYNIYKENKALKFALAKGLLFLSISILLFYSNFKLSFVILPFLFSISFMYIFFYSYQYLNNKKSHLTNIIENFGKYSWEIYLTHSIYIYFIINIIIKIINKVNINISNITIYIILMPISYYIMYIFGKKFNKIIKITNKLIYRKEKI